MDNRQPYKSDDSFSEPRLNIDMQKQEQGDFQRYTIDEKGLEIIFYQALCGWKSKIDISNEEILEITLSNPTKYYDINADMRYINEKGASSLSNRLHGLISHITTTGNLTEREIFDLWDGLIESIIFDLLTNYYQKSNPMELRIENIDTIIAYCCTYSAYTKKARGGFTLKTFQETIMSIFNTRSGLEQKPEGGLLSRILKKV
jgi:hypothetical protein